MNLKKGHKERILVIEDDEGVRETLLVALELQGYQVSTAVNGKEGLKALSEGPPPHLVLVDLMMPIMNGWEFVRALRADPSLNRVPVGLLTAYSENVGDLQNLPMIQKPIDLDLFYEFVASQCTKAIES